MKLAKPFLKWAGGKTQLIPEIENSLPFQVKTSKFSYAEPFVGSGAVLFWMLNNFPKMEYAVINDVNEDLVNTYKVIKKTPKELIALLADFEGEYHATQKKEEKQKSYYYDKRDLYNSRKSEKSLQAALFIFLNRTCFNGLYRVNQSNFFNVPIGAYKNPTICDAENIKAVSKVLKKVEILCGDYQKTLDSSSKNTFFYFDPPYKPLSTSSSFNAYAKSSFNDEEQVRLKEFCKTLDKKGYKWLLSNSDVREEGKKSSFFDELYDGFNIQRVQANRRINSKAEKRGELNELLISNYNYEQALQTA